MNAAETRKKSLGKSLIPWLVRLMALMAIAAWLSTHLDLETLPKDILTHGWAIALVACLGCFNLAIAAIRWRTLMFGFGATDRPRFGHLFRLNLIGHFYNIFVPGAVGGDLGRAFIARRCFKAASASYFVIVSERMIGLAALGVFFGIGILTGPELKGVEDGGVWSLVLMGLLALVIGGGLLGRRIARWWTGAPQLESPMAVVVATGLSLFTHSITILGFWVLTHSMELGLSVLDLAVIVPIALVASVVPLAIAGLGPREAALVAILPLLELGTAEQALALSIGFAMSNWLLGGAGGLIHLILGKSAHELSDQDTPETEPS
ncbi:MAG: hypothetical protein CMH52_00465 [Myxococcales bacterium]|nr:hypothetical protein [Myxococcales bacterium]